MAIRTLHITNAWHPASGGVRTWYLALLAAAELASRRLAVVVPGTHDSVEVRGPHTTLYTVKASALPIGDRRYRTLLPHSYLRPGGGPLGRIVERERPDLIEVSDKYALLYFAGLLKRRPGPRPTLVATSHERMDDSLGAQVRARAAGRRFSRLYLPLVYMRQFDAHVANSAYTGDELRSAAEWGGPRASGLWRQRDHIHVLPPGVDLAVFNPRWRSSHHRRALLRRSGGCETSMLVVHAGRLSPEKGSANLVPAVRALVEQGIDARLVVAGDGPLAMGLRREASQQVPGRTLWLGHLSGRDELATLLASADCFLHPNPQEPFGLGPLEAMASGTPVVLPRSGGVLTYATDENAWLAEATPEGLARAMVGVATQGELRERRRARAIQDAGAYDWRAVAPRWFALYDAIHTDRLARACDALRNVDMPVTRASGAAATLMPR